jgi:hypothetical protein
MTAEPHPLARPDVSVAVETAVTDALGRRSFIDRLDAALRVLRC